MAELWQVVDIVSLLNQATLDKNNPTGLTDYGRAHIRLALDQFSPAADLTHQAVNPADVPEIISRLIENKDKLPWDQQLPVSYVLSHRTSLNTLLDRLTQDPDALLNQLRQVD